MVALTVTNPSQTDSRMKRPPINHHCLTNPVDKYIINNIFSSLTLLQQHRLMVQQIKRQLDKDTNLLIERKDDASLYHILFSDALHLKQMQQKQNPAFF